MLILLRFINKVLSKKSSEEKIIHSFIYKYLLFYIFSCILLGEWVSLKSSAEKRSSASLLL